MASCRSCSAAIEWATWDDSGKASVDYTVREVVVRETGGSLKVRR